MSELIYEPFKLVKEEDGYYFLINMETNEKYKLYHFQDIMKLRFLLNELLNKNKQLKELLYADESQIIGEWSSNIGEDMEKLDKAYNGSIEEFIKFCEGFQEE